MNFLEWFARHLEFCGLGTVSDKETDGNIFWGTMPDQPDKAICVFSSDTSYSGSPSGARIQVMVRAKTTREAYELSQSITDELAEFYGFLAGDGPTVSVEVLNSAQGLGAEAGGKRELYSSNYIVRYCG